MRTHDAVDPKEHSALFLRDTLAPHRYYCAAIDSREKCQYWAKHYPYQQPVIVPSHLWETAELLLNG